MKQKKLFCTGLSFSLSVHASILLLCFLVFLKRPEPGGSGLVMDAFLQAGGTGFYTKGNTGKGLDDPDFTPARTEKTQGIKNATKRKTKSSQKKQSDKVYGGVIGDEAGFGAGTGTGVGIGTGMGVGDIELATYFVKLRRLFQEELIYPRQAGRVSGKATLSFYIDANGVIDLDSVRIQKSSGNDLLDAQAIKTVKRVARVPVSKIGAMTIEIPIVFKDSR